jgi:hypothetical protein
MGARNDVPPKTVGVELREEGVAVEYLDSRVTLYHGVPERVDGTLTAGPGKEVHVLVTDPTETEGVMIYVNDLKTNDEILEQSGVGRVLLDAGETESLFPGVTARRLPGERTAIEADPEVARGRVFAFVEDEWTEESYEFVAGAADAPTVGDEVATGEADASRAARSDETTAEDATGDGTASDDETESTETDDDSGWIDDPVVDGE